MNVHPRFVAWHERATRFGLGLSELVDDIPEYELERFHKLVAQIHKVYQASVNLLRTDTNGPETQSWALWQDYFYKMADRLHRKATDFQKKGRQTECEVGTYHDGRSGWACGQLV